MRLNTERAENIAARREAANKAKVDANAEAARRKEGLKAGQHRAAMAEKAKAGLAEAILKEDYNAQRIADAKARIAAAGGSKGGFTEAEIDEALGGLKETEGGNVEEARTGKSLEKAFGEDEKGIDDMLKRAGGKN